MAEYILIVESDNVLVDKVNSLVKARGVKALKVSSAMDARRALIKKLPLILVAANDLDQEENAGLKLCQSLNEHPTFKDLPVILFMDEVRADVEEKAKRLQFGFFTYKAESKLLKHSLYRLIDSDMPNSYAIIEAVKLEAKTTGLEEIVDEIKDEAKDLDLRGGVGTLSQTAIAIADKLGDSSNTKITIYEEGHREKRPTLFGLNIFGGKDKSSTESISNQVDKAHELAKEKYGSGSDDEWKDKLEQSKVILAKIFYNLKTSDLLRVVDKQEVPSIVLQMARAVCEAQGGVDSSKEKETSVDLMSVLKKK